MRAISIAPAAPRGMAGQSWAGGLVAALKRWGEVYMTWRIEQTAIAQLRSMSDRGLKDIGLTRSEITGAVRGDAARDRAFSPLCIRKIRSTENVCGRHRDSRHRGVGVAPTAWSGPALADEVIE